MTRPTAAPIIAALPIVSPRRIVDGAMPIRSRRRGQDSGVVWCGEPGELPHYGRMQRVDRRIGAPVTAAVIRCRCNGASALVLAGGRAQLAAFGLEDVVQAPFGELDAGGEPEVSGLLHVMDDAAQSERTPGPPDDVGMHGEGNVFRALRAALRVELVEIGLPGLQPVVRIAVFAVAVAEQRAVAERLPRQLDEELAVVLPEERELLVEAVGVEHEPVLDEQLDGVGALRAGAPTIAAPSRALLDHG